MEIYFRIPLRIKKLRPDAVLPEAKTDGSGGLDLTTLIGTQIFPGCTVVLPTGLAMAIPEGHVGLIRPRSSAYAKKGLDVNGTIDADYRGEIGVMLRNTTSEIIRIAQGERYAQMVIVPVPAVKVIEVDELDETARGTGGFGSTGV